MKYLWFFSVNSSGCVLWNLGENIDSFKQDLSDHSFLILFFFLIKTFKSLLKTGLTFYENSAGVPPFVICSIPSQVPCTLQKSVWGNWKYGSVLSAVQTHPSLKMCHLRWETQRTMAGGLAGSLGSLKCISGKNKTCQTFKVLKSLPTVK